MDVGFFPLKLFSNRSLVLAAPGHVEKLREVAAGLSSSSVYSAFALEVVLLDKGGDGGVEVHLKDGGPAWWSHRLEAMRLVGFVGKVMVTVTRVATIGELAEALPILDIAQRTTCGARPFTGAEMVHFIATRYKLFREHGRTIHKWAKTKTIGVFNPGSSSKLSAEIKIGVDAGKLYLEDPLYAAYYDRVMASANKAESVPSITASSNLIPGCPASPNRL